MKTIRNLILLSLVFLAIAWGFADQFEIAGAWVGDRYGMWGVLVATFFMDFIPQPFPPDIPLYSYILGGEYFWLACFLTGVVSVCGGVAGYWAGRLLKYEGAVKFIGKERHKKAHELFEKHGMAAVVVAALSPVPFNVVCWTAGIAEMPFSKFLTAAVVARFPRYFIVGLIALGANI